jgi:hypothetical protein
MGSISQVVAIRQWDFRSALDSRIVLAINRRKKTLAGQALCEGFNYQARLFKQTDELRADSIIIVLDWL